MAVARTGATSANAGVGAPNTLDVNLPTGGSTVGNIIILQCGANNGTAVTYTVPGFKAIPGFVGQSAASLCAQWAFYRICDGTEGATITVNCSTTARIVINAACYSGVDLNKPFCGIGEVNDAAVTGTVFDFPATTVDGATAYGVLLIRDRNAFSVNTVTTPSTGYSVATESSTTSTNFNHGAILDEAPVYTGVPTYSVDPANTTVGPNVSSKCATVLFLYPAVTTKGSFLGVM